MGKAIKFDAAGLAVLKDLIGKRAAAFNQELSRGMNSDLRAATPKKKGRAANGWNVGVGKPNLRKPSAKNPAPVSDPETEIAKIKADSVVYHTNNVPYIKKLENGSSKKAPAGMTRSAIARAHGRVSDAIAKARSAHPA